MRDHKLLVAVAALVALGPTATFVSLTNGTDHASAGSSTPTVTPCPTGKVFDSYHGSGCGTPTPTPTSNRPYGAQVTLVDHYPSPAVSGQKKAWVLEIENTGSQYGCEPHEVSLSAQLTGQADASFYGARPLGCHETAEMTVSSIVTVPLNATVSITAHAQAGGASGNTTYVEDAVVNPPPPTVAPTTGPPPIVALDFTVNGERENATVRRGQLVGYKLSARNNDSRNIRTSDVVESSIGGLGTGKGYLSPGSGGSSSSFFVPPSLGTITITAHVTATVDSCSACATLTWERTVTVHVVTSLGDFNCDGVINSIDAAIILQISAGMIVPLPCTGDGDVNHDGELDSVDALLILQYTARLITEFP